MEESEWIFFIPVNCFPQEYASFLFWESLYFFVFFAAVLQVALVAINLLGEKLDEDDEMTKSSSQITFEEMSQAEQRDKSLFSPYEDLAFTMYVDLEVQDLIRKMDHKKQEAVLGNFN